MRVTSNRMTSNTLRNIMNNLKDLSEVNEKLSTGKQVSKPSDDPISIGGILKARKALQTNEQYGKNISTIQGYLDVADSSLMDLQEVMQRARELVVQGSSDVLDNVSQNNIADEIAQLKDQIGTIANTKYGDRYIYGGIDISTPPYSKVTQNWQVNPAAMKEVSVKIDDSSEMIMNVNGGEVFNGEGTGRNLFNLLTDIESDLRNGKTSDLSNIRLEEIDDSMRQLSRSNSYLGAKMNRMLVIEEKNKDLKASITEELSKKEDADLAEVVTRMKELEGTYKASLSVGAKIMSMSLVDFVR